MGRNQYWAGRVYELCVYYMTGTPTGSTESGFMEKPGIEPATPGLQGIALIHYTPLKKKLFVTFPWVEISTGPEGFMICVFIILQELPNVSARFYLLTTHIGYKESTYPMEILIISGGFLHFISLGFVFKQRNLII